MQKNYMKKIIRKKSYTEKNCMQKKLYGKKLYAKKVIRKKLYTKKVMRTGKAKNAVMPYNYNAMNTIVIRRGFKRGFGDIVANMKPGKPLLVAAFAALAAYPPAREVMFTALFEAYFQVSVFVAATLFGMLIFERVRQRDLHLMLVRHREWQVLFAAVCGAIPGCGGAIFVVTQYTRGAMSFGGVVATLTATMGDAAFLLLAKSPADAATVFALCFVSGVLCGYAVDIIHGRDFLRVADGEGADDAEVRENFLLSPFYRVWMALFAPGAVIGIGYAMQADMPQILAAGDFRWVEGLGVFAASLAIAMWAFNPLSDIRQCISRHRTVTRRVVDTTNFITVWVLCGFVAYGLLEGLFAFDLGAVFDAWIWLVPLAAVLIGFIPGCGPQVVVTTLFLNGAIPLSAQLANAISNDGDALFPAVAIAPKASLLATLYTAAPAIVVGYGWMIFLE